MHVAQTHPRTHRNAPPNQRLDALKLDAEHRHVFYAGHEISVRLSDPQCNRRAEEAAVTAVCDTAHVRAIDLPEVVHRSAAHTSHTGNSESDTARACAAADISQKQKRGAIERQRRMRL